MFAGGKKAFYVTLFLTTTGVLLPAAGLCDDPRDPYIYRILYGGVQFDFGKTYSEYANREREIDTFRQTYRLDTLGNIYSRYLLTYDAGVRLVNTDTSYSDLPERNRKHINYYLKTAILPRSTTPIELSVDRTTHETSYSGVETENINTRYTLRWNLKDKKLPRTMFMVSHTDTEANGLSSDSTLYRLEMQKKLGPTTNNLFLNQTTTSDSTTTGLNLINRTRLSRDTNLRFGYARNDIDDLGIDTSTQGVSINLNSRPGLEFRQAHNYNYYTSETETQESYGQSYYGNVGYRFSRNLDTTMSLYTSESVSESATATRESSNIQYDVGANYILSPSVSLGQTVMYFYEELVTGRNRERFLTQTSVNYARDLGWAGLSTSYGIGYRMNALQEVRIDTDVELNGVDQNVAASLSNINLTRFAVFNASANYNHFADSTGTLASGSSYTLGASSGDWLKYATVSTSYYYLTNSSEIVLDNRDEERFAIDATSSYFKYLDLTLSYEKFKHSHEDIDIENRSEERFKFVASSTYFKNTRLDFSYDYYDIVDPVNGSSKTSNTNFGAGHLLTHKRALMGGDLTLQFGASRRKNDYLFGSEKVTTLNYSAAYVKRFRENANWSALASRSSTWRNGELTQVTSITNAVRTRLRLWQLQFEHRYSIFEEEMQDRTENTFFVRISRNFARMLPF